MCRGNGFISLDIPKLAAMFWAAADGRCSRYNLVRTCITEKIDLFTATPEILVALAASVSGDPFSFRGVDAVPEEPWRSIMKAMAGLDQNIREADYEASIQRDSVPVEEADDDAE